MKKNQGFTVIELLVTFTLVMVIAIFLIQIILSLKNLYVSNGIKTELLNKQALLSYKINQEFLTNDLKAATKCGSNCISFLFYDGSTSILQIDKTNNIITFGNYTTKLIAGSSFGNINVNSNLSVVNDNTKNNAILNINIPIYNKVFDNTNFGVNINVQYNTLNTNITNILFDNENTENGFIMIKGSRNVTIANSEEYIDMGYVYYDSEGIATDSSPYVEVINPFNAMENPYVSGTHTVIYKLKDNNGNVIQTLERKVTVL